MADYSDHIASSDQLLDGCKACPGSSLVHAMESRCGCNTVPCIGRYTGDVHQWESSAFSRDDNVEYILSQLDEGT